MLSTFLYAFHAVAPLVLLIFFGYWLRKINFFTDSFVSLGYKFSFRCALPCLLFCNVYSIDSIESLDFRIIGYSVALIFVLFFLGILASLIWVPDRRQRGVVIQCFFRSNAAVIGLTLAESLGGIEASRCIAMVTAVSIPLFNVLAVIALVAFQDEGEEQGVKHGLAAINWKRIGKKIVTNPLIIAVGCGLLCLAIRSFIPVNENGEKVFLLSNQLYTLYSLVKNLSQMASPFMLLMLGGQFTFSAVKTLRKQIVLATVGRTILAPLLAVGGAILLTRTGLFSFGSPEYAALIALFASPVAVSSAIMAREMKNDDILAGQLVVWTSIVSVVTLFLTVVLLRMGGLL